MKSTYMKKTTFVFAAWMNAASAWGCYEDFIRTPSPFMGNNGEVFQLGDGSIWQVEYAYEYLYEYYPSIIICPSINKLIIGDVQIDVRSLSQSNNQGGNTIIESNIDGTFNGWSGDTIVKLTNGQIWQQQEYYYEYSYAYRPDVLIYQASGRYKMKVEGTDQAVGVIRLK